MDTDANNSLAVNDSLFGMFTVGGRQAFGTTSTASNIHSHYVGANCYDWTDYEFSWREVLEGSPGPDPGRHG